MARFWVLVQFEEKLGKNPKPPLPPCCGDFVTGWTFSTSTTISVTHLGKVDMLNDGLNTAGPIDDARSINPPSNPELLDALAEDFIDSGYDVKHLIRVICNSYAYRLDAAPTKRTATTPRPSPASTRDV